MAEPTPDLLGQAAETYRHLAEEAPDPEAGRALAGAGDNEDAIADILEALDPDHAQIEADLHARFPQLDGLFGSVLDGRPYAERLRLQQAAELGAADLFRALAEAEPDPDARRKLLDCSGIEKGNAAVLGAQLE